MTLACTNTTLLLRCSELARELELIFASRWLRRVELHRSHEQDMWSYRELCILHMNAEPCGFACKHVTSLVKTRIDFEAIQLTPKSSYSSHFGVGSWGLPGISLTSKLIRSDKTVIRYRELFFNEDPGILLREGYEIVLWLASPRYLSASESWEVA